MAYWHWLIAISLVFVVVERLTPWRPGQGLLRRGWVRDVGFLALNGHLFSLWTGAVTGAVAAGATSALRSWGLGLDEPPLARWPFAAQFVVLLVLADFLQWCIHNLLHRAPWLAVDDESHMASL